MTASFVGMNGGGGEGAMGGEGGNVGEKGEGWEGATQEIVLAILHQAEPPPPANGVRKPMKPGGYRDSGADIFFALSKHVSPTPNLSVPAIKVLRPSPSPSSSSSSSTSPSTEYTFPDTAASILAAVRSGATHLWANTILHSTHPLQASPQLAPYLDTVRVVGQPPNLVDAADDKEFVNACLRAKDRRGEAFTLPRAWGVESAEDVQRLVGGSAEGWRGFPVVGKPIRGRGSAGVRVCWDSAELESHVATLLAGSSRAMVEEFLGDEEATIAVLPPSVAAAFPVPSPSPSRNYRALPPVLRTAHAASHILPYNGEVPVSRNSRVVTRAEVDADPAWDEVMGQCVRVAEWLGATAPVRIDVRRFSGGDGGGGREEEEKKKGKFALFDINMKPNMTGPSRPGREDQTSLVGIAASGWGWDYERLLLEMLGSARTLREVRVWRWGERGGREEMAGASEGTSE